MDAKQIIAEVGNRHGILLDANDPVLVTVTLNQVVLAECLRAANAAAEQGEQRAISASERQLAHAKQVAGELVTRTAGYVADQVRTAADEASSEIERRVASAAASFRSHEKAAKRHRDLALVFMSASALATALTLGAVGSTWRGAALWHPIFGGAAREDAAAVDRGHGAIPVLPARVGGRDTARGRPGADAPARTDRR